MIKADKLTRWEKYLIDNGTEIITRDHDIIADYLLAIFDRDKDHLLLQAASDCTKRHELCFILDYEGMGGVGDTNFGGTVHYNKKQRRFTYIQYSDKRNWAVQFSIASKVSFHTYDFHQQYKHIFPFGCSKKFAAYLISN